jgi:hypothetical protein
MMPILERVDRPSIELPDVYPDVPLAEYESRFGRLVRRMEAEHLDVMVVYGDREHSGHQEYLCGVAPRFEESILLLNRAGDRILLLGNENQAYAPDPALNIEVRLFQDLSPLGQARGDSLPLWSHLADIGIGAGTSVGCAGWKYFTPTLVEDASHAIDLPAFLVDALRKAAGGYEHVRNVNGIFLDPATGLRVATNDVHQIAQFEYAASVTSSSVWETLTSIAVGARERDIEGHLLSRGLPLSCHNMISFGDKVRRGLSSPSDNAARLGDAFVIAQGLRGSLTARAGAVAEGPDQLTGELRTFYPELVSNYFDVVTTWYESVRVGVTAGDVFREVEKVRDASLFSYLLNPGHYLSIEEWANSPFEADDPTVLSSGMALQTDIIPVSQGPYCYTNLEDGVVLADGELREQLQEAYPALWERVLTRRQFMSERIGVELHESVLPLSNTPALLAPYALTPELVLRRD